jgi:glycosyltransferase involved in cell wall biosynthesis
MKRLSISWTSNRSVIAGGQGFGYTSASVNLRDALARRRDVEITHRGDVALHFCHPHDFHPELWPHRVQVLLTMYEVDPCPPEFGRGMARADAVVTPSQFSRSLLEKARMPEGAHRPPIFVSRLGFDPDRFPLLRRPDRLKPNEKFRCLWGGAPNQRKGFHLLAEEWFYLSDVPWLELTLKAAVARQELAEVFRTCGGCIHRGHAGQRCGREIHEIGVDAEGNPHERTRECECTSHLEGNMVWDERRKTRAEMAELYAGHHLFVFPTLGEGFGLTPLEAAATGMPVMVTNHSSPNEFIREKDGHMLMPTIAHTVVTSQGVIAKCRRPQPGAIVRGIKTMMREYPERAQRAFNAASRLRREYSWDAAAEELVVVLRRVLDGDRRQAA